MSLDWCIIQGAIYATDNTAYTWKAAVQETVDATLNRTVSSGKIKVELEHCLFQDWLPFLPVLIVRLEEMYNMMLIRHFRRILL